jgi:hypothetical protein
MDIRTHFASTSSVAGTITVSIPSGYTIDSTKVSSANNTTLGTAYANDATGNLWIGNVLYSTSTGVVVTGDNAAGAWNATRPITWATSDVMDMFFSVPIAEWSGSGTVNLAQNDVSWAADDGSSDVFGPNGALVPNQTATTSTTARAFAFSAAKQDQDLYICEVNYRGFGWSACSDVFPFVSGNNGSSNNFYGIQGLWTSSTTYTMYFGNQGTAVSASNASAGSTSWATEYAAGTRFRVRKASGGSAVGFGAASQTSLGLVKAGQVPGTNTNDSASTGNVGEAQRQASAAGSQALTTTAYTTLASITLSAGDWDISGIGEASATTSFTGMYLCISTANNASTGCTVGDNLVQVPGTSAIDASASIPNWRVQLSGSQTYYLVAKSAGANTTAGGRLSARRVR